ncbi:MAG: hypothetical protein J6K21_02495 [Bacilli bacterium]|nr:hypothetical protein [Bacilli bacterium]
MNLYINCSPKIKNSNSEYFTQLIKSDNDIINYIYKDNFELIKKNISIYKNIIFVFPLYMDTFPSKLIEFMENFNNKLINKNIYIICNCGFLEYRQNFLAIDTFIYWINKKKGFFKGYLNIGSGEIIGITKKNKFLSLFCHDFFKKIKIFKCYINNEKSINLNTNIKWLNKRLFCIICNHFWKKRIK